MVDVSRRGFLRGRPRADRAPPMRPPWSAWPDDRFTAACTRCGDCVRSCPEHVLAVGDGGFPEIRFTQTGCTLCGDCARACPSGAIRLDPDAEAFPWRVNVGAACLTHHGVECRICGDACEMRALRFVPAIGGIAQLRIDADACTGCGACAPVCPVGAVTFETGKTDES